MCLSLAYITSVRQSLFAEHSDLPWTQLFDRLGQIQLRRYRLGGGGTAGHRELVTDPDCGFPNVSHSGLTLAEQVDKS